MGNLVLAPNNLEINDGRQVYNLKTGFRPFCTPIKDARVGYMLARKCP